MSRLHKLGVALLFVVTASACSETDATADRDIEVALSFIATPSQTMKIQSIANFDFVDNRRATSWWNADEQAELTEIERWIQHHRGLFTAESPVVREFDTIRQSLHVNVTHRDVFGFGLEDLRLVAAPIGDRYSISIGSFDEANIRQALESDTDWAHELREESTNGFEYWDWGNSFDPERTPTPFRDLAIGGQLYVDEVAGVAVRKGQIGLDVTDAFDAKQGDNLADDELVGLLTAVDDAGAIFASIWNDTYTREDLAQLAPTEISKDRVVAAALLPTIEYFVLGRAFDASFDEPNVARLLGATFSSTDDAQLATRRIEQSLEVSVNGTSWNDLTTSINVTTSDAWVLVSVTGMDSDDTSLLLRSLFLDS